MPTEILPSSFTTLVAQLAPVFTAPSFESFRVLVAGWVFAVGRHCISDVVRAAGAQAKKHFTSYYRFLSAGHWCLDELGLALLGLVLQILRIEEVELVLDDTLFHVTQGDVLVHALFDFPLEIGPLSRYVPHLPHEVPHGSA